jgi:hypothetical protein
MEFSAKDYAILKTKVYIKNNNLFFFFNSVNKNSNDEILTEQKLKKSGLAFVKIQNKTAKKTLQNSILINSKELINCSILIIKQNINKNELKKINILNNFEPLLLTILALKLNNKIYSKTQLKELLVLNYKDIQLLLFQFTLTNIKLSVNFSYTKI